MNRTNQDREETQRTTAPSLCATRMHQDREETQHPTAPSLCATRTHQDREETQHTRLDLLVHVGQRHDEFQNMRQGSNNGAHRRSFPFEGNPFKSFEPGDPNGVCVCVCVCVLIHGVNN